MFGYQFNMDKIFENNENDSLLSNNSSDERSLRFYNGFLFDDFDLDSVLFKDSHPFLMSSNDLTVSLTSTSSTSSNPTSPSVATSSPSSSSLNSINSRDGVLAVDSIRQKTRDIAEVFNTSSTAAALSSRNVKSKRKLNAKGKLDKATNTSKATEVSDVHIAFIYIVRFKRGIRYFTTTLSVSLGKFSLFL